MEACTETVVSSININVVSFIRAIVAQYDNLLSIVTAPLLEVKLAGETGLDVKFSYYL